MAEPARALADLVLPDDVAAGIAAHETGLVPDGLQVSEVRQVLLGQGAQGLDVFGDVLDSRLVEDGQGRLVAKVEY